MYLWRHPFILPLHPAPPHQTTPTPIMMKMQSTQVARPALQQQQLAQVSRFLATQTHQTDRARLCVDDTLQRAACRPSCSYPSLASRLQDVSRAIDPVRRPQAGELSAGLAKAEAALQQWQRAEHAVVQCALELHECDSGTGLLKARRNEYLAWRAYSKALDELKVLEYRLNNQGNAFRGSFQLNEFGYDYGRDVPEMSEQERTAALNKRRQLKLKTASLKAAWQRAAAVLEAMTVLHEEALAGSQAAWAQAVVGADAAKEAAVAALVGCEALAEGLPRRQQQHYQLGPLEELPTSEDEEDVLLVSSLGHRPSPAAAPARLTQAAMLGGALAAASLSVLTLPGQAAASSKLQMWMPYLAGPNAQTTVLAAVGGAALAAALLANSSAAVAPQGAAASKDME